MSASSLNSGSAVAASSAGNEDNAAAALPPLSSIWDCQYIEKCQTIDGKPGWKCHWCGITFAGVNASKALVHPSKMFRPSAHVQPCKAIVELAYRDRYRALIEKKDAEKAARVAAKATIQSELREESKEVGDALQARKKARRSSGSWSGQEVILMDEDDRKPAANQGSASTTRSSNNGRQVSMEAYSDAPRPKIQSTILGSNESACDAAFAKMIHAKNLSLDFGQDKLVKNCLHFARMVGPNYEPPKKDAVGGVLLTENLNKTKEKRDKALMRDSDIFGLSMMGDGATIKKKPFFNILAYGYHLPAAVLAIVDCTKHLVAGGKKDAEYIARQFLPHMEAMDAMKDRIDLFIVDGASNVQKAGQVVEVVFPRASVLHGAEHCLSLFFTDVAKIPSIKVSRYLLTCTNIVLFHSLLIRLFRHSC